MRFFSIVSLAIISVAGYAESPEWITKTNFSDKDITVEGIEEVSGVGLYILGSGLGSNLRAGVKCSVLRGEKEVASLVIVESNYEKSVAIALSGTEIKTGDIVRINIIK